MPLIISETLRSAVLSANSTQGIVTILLSSADLAKLDLSNLQLFTSDSFDLTNHQSAQPPAVASAQDTDAAKLAHGDCNSSDKLANAGQEANFHSPGRPLASEHDVADDEFSFQTPMILSPARELTPGDIPFPIFKSRAVADAERASGSQQSLSMGDICLSSQRKKVICMNEDRLEQQTNGETYDDHTTALKAQDESGISVAVRGRSNRVRPKAQLTQLVLERPELERTAEESKSLREVSEEAMIDLKASPAAKFLLQVMPWELTPSPVSAANTPASIPFLWEDVPGKPKPQEIPSPLPSLRLPPRLASAPSPAFNSTKPSVNSTRSREKSSSPSESSNNPVHHRKNTHSWHVLQNIFSGQSRHSSHEEAAFQDTSFGNSFHHRDSPNFKGRQTNEGATLSNPSSGGSSSFDASPIADVYETNLRLEHQLPSLYVATIVPPTSPYRDLGPTDDHHIGRRRKFSIAGSGIKFFANILRRRRDTRLTTDKRHGFPEKLEHVSEASVPSPSNAYRNLRSGKRRIRRRGGTARVFCRLRRRGSRLLVAIYRAVKCALLVRRADHTKLMQDKPLQYHKLQ